MSVGGDLNFLSFIQQLRHGESHGKKEDSSLKEIEVAVTGKARAIAELYGEVSRPLIDMVDRGVGTSEHRPKLGLGLKDNCAT